MSDLRIGGGPIAKLKVAELKAELEARELSKTGKKDELVARLISFMEVNECSEPSSENSSRTETPNAEVSELWAKQREEMLAAAQKNKEEAERRAAEEEAAQLAEEEEQRRKKEEEKAERQRRAEEAKRAKEEEKRRKEEEKQKLVEEKAEKARLEAEEKERIKAEEEEAKRELEKKRMAQEEQAKREAEAKRASEEAERAKAERKAAEEKDKAEKKAAEENARKIKLAAEEAERWMEEKKQQEEEKRKEEMRKKEEERKKEVARLKEEKAKADQKMKEEREQKKREEEEKRRAEEEKKRAEKEKAKEEEQKKKDEERKQREEEKKRREADREKDEQRMKDRQRRFEEEEKSEKRKQEASTNGKSRGMEEKKATPAGDADEEALDFEPEAAADDALVMEVDQHDLVDQEEKEEVINAQPGEVTSLRKLGGNRVQGERKRGWGAGGARLGSGDGVAISSNTLKDLVPDPKNLLEKPDVEIEDELGADVAGPKPPKGQEPPRKRRKIPEVDLNETEVIIITNLTRPFTVNQLKEMLKRTGTIVDFWIDRIKSKCCVEFTSTDQASETRMALDGVTWPQSNPKTLRVSFGTKEEMKKLAEGGEDAGVIGRLGVELEGRSLLRDWDRNKVDQEKERERERLDERRGRREVRERSIEEPAPVATKSLEELFKKTTAGPAIYWRPLSEEEIQAKIDEKNKKVDEAKSQKDMMASKEAQEKTKRMGEALGLVPATNRKRSRSSSGSPR